MNLDALFSNVDYKIFFDYGFKIASVVISIVYLYYSLVFIRQVSMMKETISINDGNFLNFLAYCQLGISVFIFLYAILVL